MKAREKERVRDKVEAEGFDYCFRYYSDFPEIKDEEFHKLRESYKEAAEALAEYIGLED